MNRRFPFACISAFLLLLFCGFASAQVGPTGTGSIMLSGKADFSSKGGELYGGFDDNAQRITFFSGSGSAGFFVLPYVALGASGSLETESYENFSEITWELGPEAWIFMGGSREENAAGSIYPFITAGFFYKQTISEFSIDWLENGLYDEKSTDDMTTIKLGGGICYMITNTVGLIFEVDYEIDRVKLGAPNSFDGTDELIKGNNVNILAGISAFIH